MLYFYSIPVIFASGQIRSHISMSEKEVIKKILDAATVSDAFKSLDNWPQEYKEYIRLIHPDVCNVFGSMEATAKLNRFRDELHSGKSHNDDAGRVIYAFKTVDIVGIGDTDLLKKSLDNYNLLMSLKDEASKHFQKYLPVKGELIAATKMYGTQLRWTLPNRALPVSSLGVLEQKHSNWVLNRMLEFAGWINQSGFCHGGINPDSVYVVPENHGMVCISFYHMVKLDSKMSTISAKYRNFYPDQLFTYKQATSNIDVELCKRTAIYALGDRSGSGVLLRKSHELEIVDFLQRRHDDPIEAYHEHKKIIKKYFDTKKFHVLTV